MASLENLDPTLLVWLLGLGYSFVSCTIGPRFLASKMRRIVAEVYHSEPPSVSFRIEAHDHPQARAEDPRSKQEKVHHPVEKSCQAVIRVDIR